MMREKLTRLALRWPSDHGDPPTTDYQRGYMAACIEHSREVITLLAEPEEGPYPDAWADAVEARAALTAARREP